MQKEFGQILSEIDCESSFHLKTVQVIFTRILHLKQARQN